MLSILVGVGYFFLFIMVGLIHPFTFGLGFMGFSLIISVCVGYFLSGWYGFVFFLIFISGILVVFSFTSALSPISRESGGLNLFLGVFFKVIFVMFMMYSLLFMMGDFSPLYWVSSGLFDMSDSVFSGGSSNSGVLFLSVVWGFNTIWLALVLFGGLIICSFLCKSWNFPIRGYSGKGV